MEAVYKLVANYLDDANYFSGTFQFTGVESDASLTITLYKSGDVLREETWDHFNLTAQGMNQCYLQLCLTGENFSACLSFEGAATVFCRCTFDPELIEGGYKAGLGNESNIAIAYNSFELQETDYTLPDKGCQACLNGCGCLCSGGDTLCEDGGPLFDGKEDLYFEITSDCPSLDGLYGLLTYHYTPPTPELPWWDYYFESGILSSLWLQCDPDGTGVRWQNYVLGVESRPADCGAAINGIPTAGSCKPFSLTFSGELDETFEGGCDGTGCADGDAITITISCPPAAMAHDATSPEDGQRRRPSVPTPDVDQRSGPGLANRAGRYAAAVAKWNLAGRPRRTDAEVDAILAICTPCGQFDGQQCSLCGCRINKSKRAIANKARMATEHCPKNLW